VLTIFSQTSHAIGLPFGILNQWTITDYLFKGVLQNVPRLSHGFTSDLDCHHFEVADTDVFVMAIRIRKK
jgi:hypothetical protein